VDAEALRCDVGVSRPVLRRPVRITYWSRNTPKTDPVLVTLVGCDFYNEPRDLTGQLSNLSTSLSQLLEIV
jgi:hypothetical protein